SMNHRPWRAIMDFRSKTQAMWLRFLAIAFCWLTLAGQSSMFATEPPQPPRIPKELERFWRLTIWQNDFSGIGLSIVSIQIKDQKVTLAPLPEAIQKWGRSISDLEFKDNLLRFKVTYDTVSDDTKTKPLKQEWFEGRFDPKHPNRIWGVLGPKDAAEDEKGFRYGILRQAELNPVPAKPEVMILKDVKTGAEQVVEDSRWAMATVISPGLGAVQSELNTWRNELAQGKIKLQDSPDRAIGQFWALQELAADRKPNRRGYFMLRMLVRNAHIASVEPDRVRGWLNEILDYTAPYGPRFDKQLRFSIAEELKAGPQEDYQPLIEQLIAGKPFPAIDRQKR
ncbi:MAG: hypothetical protein ACRCZF_20075, partial [Gemmataceae bacterium]